MRPSGSFSESSRASGLFGSRRYFAIASATTLVCNVPSSANADNAASVIHQGRCLGHYFKRELPNYAVFDERRYFTAGEHSLVFTVQGTVFGVAICEDVWLDAAPQAAQAAGAQTLLVLNASPYHSGKLPERQAVVRQHVCRMGLAYIGVNHVGGQDELVFDGGSFALNAAGECTAHLAQFTPALACISVAQGQPLLGAALAPPLGAEAQVYAALVLATQDYVHKNGFKHVLLGLSGGVDSAVAALLLREQGYRVVGATLTLPGLAGIVLSIGIAVDANVLVYERIREELRGGRNAISAIDAGFRRALSTILDSNITTFIAAAVLFYIGTGPVRGFAVTLGIGIITTLSTTEYNPFLLARLTNTLDHVSDGRAGPAH